MKKLTIMIACVTLTMEMCTKTLKIEVTREMLLKDKATFYVMQDGKVSRTNIPEFIRVSALLTDEKIYSPAGVYSPQIELVNDLQYGTWYVYESFVFVSSVSSQGYPAMKVVGGPGTIMRFWYKLDPSSIPTDEQASVLKEVPYFKVKYLNLFMDIIKKYEKLTKEEKWPTQKSRIAAEDRYGMKVLWKTTEEIEI